MLKINFRNMKLRNFFIGLAVAAASAAAVSCSDDFDRPPVIVPEATIEANTTILELKERYWQGTGSYLTEIGLTDSGEHIIIAGRVVSSDECGNIYQRIVIEDETAAIPVRVYATGLYETYHYGQEVRMDVTGLLMGTYNGWLMIGVEYNSGIGGMDKTVMTERAQVNGLPDAREITDYTVTIPAMNGVNTSDVTEFMTWQSRFVTLENVEFVDGGKQPFGDNSDNAYVTRYIKDADGNRMVVNTSNKCTFKGTTMPTGTGTVRAILSYYRSDWQLVISNPATDCIGFDPMGEPVDPGTPTVPGDAAAQISADFEDGQLPAGWTAVATSGDRTWFVKDFNNNFYAQCSAYKGKAGSEGFRSWLITSAVDVDKMTEKVMSFETEIQYGPNEGNMQLYVLDSNDPTKAQMVEMTYTQPNPTSAASSGYVFSGEIDLSQFSGVKYIGWLYIASDPDNSRTYRVDNVKIGFKADQEPVTPPTPAGGTLYTALDENATSIDWTLTNTEIWKWAEYSGKHYLNVSAFNKPEFYGQDSYAESPVIDLTSASKATLTFDHAAKFQTTLKQLCGVVVKLEGATEWTELTIPEWPAAGAWTFVSSGAIDLSAYAGKKIQLAFKYGCSAEGADQWEIKNLKITE